MSLLRRSIQAAKWKGHILGQADHGERKPPALPNLTALRFFAAAMVVAYHFTDNGREVATTNRFAPLITQGFLGVPLFFVLSGFVLAYSHEVVTDWRRFYLARFARVYPLALFALICMMPFAYLQSGANYHPLSFMSIALNCCLTQAWFPHYEYTINGPEWTLSVEAFFYALFPFLLPYVTRRLRMRWFWIVTIWIIFLIQPLLDHFTHVGVRFGLHDRALTVYSSLTHYVDAPPCFLGEFLMGMFAGAQMRRHPKAYSISAVIGSVTLCTAALFISPYIPLAAFRNSGIALTFVPLLITLSGWRSTILGSKLFQFGGGISFSIYLLQMLVYMTFRSIWGTTGHKVLMFGILLAMSIMSYLWIEKPARLLILRHFGQRTRDKPIPTQVSIP